MELYVEWIGRGKSMSWRKRARAVYRVESSRQLELELKKERWSGRYSGELGERT